MQGRSLSTVQMGIPSEAQNAWPPFTQLFAAQMGVELAEWADADAEDAIQVSAHWNCAMVQEVPP